MAIAHAVMFADEAGPSSPTRPSRSTPCRVSARQANESKLSGGAREGLVPLGAAKTVAALTSRRGVNFSPMNDTKYFHSAEAIVPAKDDPPPSIRSYPQSDHLATPSTHSSSPAPSSQRSSTPTSVRGILKQRIHQIRVAASVEEGTLNNKEPARLLVSGTRPRLIARDSFQLAMLRKAASDGLDGSGKGKGRAQEDVPSSDDTPTSSSDAADREQVPNDASSEIEEEVEETGSLSSSSLIEIILEGAEDLLTLEEAYTTLAGRLRQHIPAGGLNTPTRYNHDDIEIATTPIKEEAPAMVRAMQRDIQRLLGKVPSSDVHPFQGNSSPFRTLMPLHESTPPTSKSRLTPSPTPIPSNKRLTPDDKPKRQGYTEAEVRYRREAAGVGCAALRFLAFLFSAPHLFNCFSEADLTSLLDQIMVIPRTPSLPTPNTKRTYYLSILILAHMRVPSACVAPLKEKIVRALESAMSDGMGGPASSPNAKDSSAQIKKEAFLAIINLFSTYPSIVFPYFGDLLTPCLKSLVSPTPLWRTKAATAIAAVAACKLELLQEKETKTEWMRNRGIATKLEQFVVAHLKSAVRIPGKPGPIYGVNGEKRTEWHDLERVFKDTVGSPTEVQWACATWANLVTLMGTSYSTSGLASSFDHIMDRSLQPSTNIVRPLLARVAWSHAIHAYLSAGSVSSMTEDGDVITTYRPFVQSANGDYAERLKTIQLPVVLALQLALDTGSVSCSVQDGVWKWRRVEKSKKLQWMMTCGQGAATVVYAFTGTALYHQEQPAKEMSAISGLASSDGVPIPDTETLEATMGRLDKVWDRVARPMIKSLSSVLGADDLKIHGWGILDAILLNQSTSTKSWSFDRLLSRKYIDGEAFAMEKEGALNDLLDAVDKEAIRASDIPAWGNEWVVKRLDSILDLFEDLLTGIGGIAEADSIRWIKDEHANPLIPTTVSRIWSSVLRSIATTSKDSPKYTAALGLIVRHLLQVFNRDPSTYVPIGALTVDKKTLVDADTLRFGLFSHLLNAAINVLGRDAFGATRIQRAEDADAVDTIISQTAFGADTANGTGATIAGCLLGQLLRTQVLSFPLRPPAMSAFKNALVKILDVGAVQGFSGKLLGDITNHMPWIFQDQEDVQLCVWRVLALKWVEVIDLQPSNGPSNNNTNHTGALLVSLLSGPFRGRQVTSAWHQRASTEDLSTWSALLKVTVLRYRAKRVGSNLGVLESLAGHLDDFLSPDPKTYPTTITLSCLAAAVSYISFVPREAHHANHFSINENFVPVDFLVLVREALLHSYPSQESLDESQGSIVISPAVQELILALKTVVGRIPAEFVSSVLSPVKDGLGIWLQDSAKIVTDDEFSQTLDETYITILKALQGAIADDHLAADRSTMANYIDLYAPRLSRARSSDVAKAFKEFYQSAFGAVKIGEMDSKSRSFVEQVVSAVPGLVSVPGLNAKEDLSEEEKMESQEQFPHALDIAQSPSSRPNISQSFEKPEVAVEEAEVLVDCTVVEPTSSPANALEAGDDYDGSVSQSQTQAPKQTRSQTRAQAKRSKRGTPRATRAQMEKVAPPSDVVPSSAPSPAPAVESEPEPEAVQEHEEVSEEAVAPVPVVDTEDPAADATQKHAEDGDVFGPTSGKTIAKPSKRTRGRSNKKRGGKTRPLGDSDSMPEAKRARSSEEGDEGHDSRSLPTSNEAFAADSYSSSPFSPADAKEEQVSPAPTSTSGESKKSKKRSSPPQDAEIIDLTQSPEPVRIAESDRRSHRPSLLSSARGWLSKVNSFSLFSPTAASDASGDSPSPDKLARKAQKQKVDDEVEEDGRGSPSPVAEPPAPVVTEVIEHEVAEPDEDDVESSKEQEAEETSSSRKRSTRKGRSEARRLTRSSKTSNAEPAEPAATAEDMDTPVRTSRSKSKTPVAALQQAEEDELLLTPETARKRRREEAGEIAAASEPETQTQSQSVPSKGRKTRSKAKAEANKSESERFTQGRFDDAEETQLAIATRAARAAARAAEQGQIPVPPSPAGVPPTPARTTAQDRVLRMVEQAAASTGLIDGLDFEGVLDLLRNVDALRQAAQANLEKRAQAERAAKRARRK